MNGHAVIIGALLVAGAFLHLLAWTELEEFNWFDIVMRGAPPYEDLSGTGQACVLGSWLCGIAAVALVILEYVVPRFGSMGPLA